MHVLYEVRRLNVRGYLYISLTAYVNTNGTDFRDAGNTHTFRQGVNPVTATYDAGSGQSPTQ